MDALRKAVIQSIKEKDEKAEEMELIEAFNRKVGYFRIILKLVSTVQT